MNKGGNPSSRYTPLETKRFRRADKGNLRPPMGFTIVETLIVLAVTGGLFVSAVLLINGRQARTEFVTGVNNVKQQVQQVINETASGFFPDANSFNCSAGAGGGTPTINAGPGNGQGTNTGCIFLGKIMQFAPSDDPTTFAVHTVAGNGAGLTSGNGLSLFGVTGAAPKDVDLITTSQKLINGLTVYSMDSTPTIGGTGGVGFIAGDTSGNIAASDSAGLKSGSQQLSLYAIRSTSANSSSINLMSNQINTSFATKFVNVSQVAICLVSGGTNQSALLTIGDATVGGSQFSVDLSVRGNLTCA